MIKTKSKTHKRLRKIWHGVKNWFSKLYSRLWDTLFRCDGFEIGSLELSHGLHEVEIATASEPTCVWVAFTDSQAMPVCMGDVDVVGVTLTSKGFVLVANIASTSRQIDWYAILG